MRNYYVTRDSTSFKYKETSFPNSGWNRFKDSVTDIESMYRFFTDNDRTDRHDLQFVNKNNQSTTIAEIKRNEDNTFNVAINAGERKHRLTEFDFIPYAEQVQFFHDRATLEIREQAFNLDQFKAVEFYKKQADEHTREEYQLLIKEKTSNAAVVSLLKQREGENAEIYFLDE